MSCEIEDVRLIQRIAALGRMAEVARETGLSPATVSARLKAVEERLGVRLFLRTTRSLALTEEGRRFVEAGDRVLAEWEGLIRAMRGHGEEMIGPIRVTAPQDTGVQHMAPLLDAFQREFPDVSIDLNLDDALVDLVGGGFDIALRTGDLRDSRLKVRHLLAAPRVIVASPGYLAMAGRPETPGDLLRHRCICRRVGGLVVDEWPFMMDGAPASVRVRAALMANDGAQTRRWALDGAGLALKSWLDVAHDLHNGRLVSVLDDWRTAPLRLSMVTPPRAPEPRRVSVLKDRVVAYFNALTAACPMPKGR